MTEAAFQSEMVVREATFPVVEMFGPTVQGEGPDAGVPAYFIRFGGCDFRCSWCDSMYAVDPILVKRESRRISANEILDELDALKAGPQLVVLTGGNPAMFDLGRLVGVLQERGLRVAVETQGSLWKAWLGDVDRLVVSPKPPSSGMATIENRKKLAAFMDRAVRTRGLALKIVVFDERDLEWARAIAREYAAVPLFLSAGTDVGLDDQQTLVSVQARFRWLCEAVSVDDELATTRVLPQLHVVAWGTKRGV